MDEAGGCYPLAPIISLRVDRARGCGEGDFITPTRDVAPAPPEYLAPAGP